MPPSKPLPQVFIIIHQADRNCSFLQNSKRGGEDYGVEKITKINKGVGDKS